MKIISENIMAVASIASEMAIEESSCRKSQNIASLYQGFRSNQAAIEPRGGDRSRRQ